MGMTKILTKQEQLTGLKEVHNALTRLQSKLPGKNYVLFENLKNAVAQINNSIGTELEETKPVHIEDLPAELNGCVSQ